MCILCTTVFPLKGGNIALPHPLVLLSHSKFTLKNNTDWTLLIEHHVPWMYSPTLNIYPGGNTVLYKPWLWVLYNRYTTDWGGGLCESAYMVHHGAINYVYIVTDSINSLLIGSRYIFPMAYTLTIVEPIWPML